MDLLFIRGLVRSLFDDVFTSICEVEQDKTHKNAWVHQADLDWQVERQAAIRRKADNDIQNDLELDRMMARVIRDDRALSEQIKQAKPEPYRQTEMDYVLAAHYVPPCKCAAKGDGTKCPQCNVARW